MKRRAWILTLVLVLIVNCLGGVAFAKKKKDDGPVRDEPSTGKLEFRIYGEFGNQDMYRVENVEPLEDNVLTGRTFYWLGSSVTYGAASQQMAVPEYLAARNSCTCVKEAVSGTTLFTGDEKPETSYVSRMLDGAFDKDAKIDAFICQISTNDMKEKNLSHYGELPADYSNTSLDSFDLSTTLGSVQYIIEYVEETWDCPVYFYSGSWFGDEKPHGETDPTGTNYSRLVADVHTIADNWNAKDGYTVKVIDLFNDKEFNDLVTETDYEYLMGDAIHPRQSGYLVWWTPYFEDFLYKEFAE